ncbi:MAG: PP2C family serine/threonine-protein phosphatase [Bacteroidota bacterium]
MDKIIYKIARSIRGNSHVEKRMPNQDSIIMKEYGNHTMVAVADGHGSEECYRSHTGSRFAVEEFSRIMEKVPFKVAEVSVFLQDLPAEIVTSWRKRVEEDLETNPFSEKEITTATGANPYLAYGSTLLGCCIGREYRLFIQIGDGDMFGLFPDGKTQRLVPDDPRCSGDESTSLCAPLAFEDFRCVLLDSSMDRPEVIILATDGLAKSYANDEDLFQWTTDIKALIRKKNQSSIDENLALWLEEISTASSRDDISMAIICLEKNNALPTPEMVIPAKKPEEKSGRSFFRRLLPKRITNHSIMNPNHQQS